MYVCLCHAVNDKRIERELRRGARSVRELQTRCAVGTECGQCLRALKRIVEEASGAGPAAHEGHSSDE